MSLFFFSLSLFFSLFKISHVKIENGDFVQLKTISSDPQFIDSIRAFNIQSKMFDQIVILTLGSFDCICLDSKKSTVLKM